MNGKSMISSSVAAVLMAVLLPVAVLLTGCSEDGNPVIPGIGGKHDLVLSTSVGNVGYVSTVENLEQGSATNELAVEVGGQWPAVYVHGDMLLVSESFFGDRVYRYDRGAGGELIAAGALTMPAQSWPCCIVFASATKAYIGLYNAGKLVIINPTTMTITGEIDLSEFGIGDNNPEPAEMVIRDGKLFVALHQMTSQFSLDLSAHVLIVDVATDAVDKVITDERTCMAGTRESATLMFVDDEGDLYVYGWAMGGMFPGTKDGFLRIRKGQTEFDPDYYFSIQDLSLADVPGNYGANAYDVVYTGGSTLYGFVVIPGLMSDPPDYINDRNYQPFKIDFGAGTAEKIALKPSGYASGVCQYDDKIVFALSTIDGNGLYTYDPATGAVSSKPVVTVEGSPMYIGAF